MKKKTLIAIGIALIISLVGCGSNETTSAEAPANDTTAEETTEIQEIEEAVVQTEEVIEESTESEYATLNDFLKSDSVQETLNSVNQSLEESGLTCDFQAENENTLIFKYTYIDQIDLAPSKELEEALDAELAPVLLQVGSGMVDEFKGYGFDISAIRITICNADNTEFYSKVFDL